jgi:diguanylate cyclase (GGDEF)-like protein/PAS domain S-box-containing protein
MPAISKLSNVTDGRVLHQHLAFALAEVTDAVITASHDDRITYMNAAAEQITRFRSEDALGERLSEVLSIVDTNTGGAIDEALDAVKQAEEHRKVLQHAVVLGGAETPVIIEYCVSAMRDPQGNFFGSATVFRDIMRRRASELALEASEETLLANAAALFEEKERAHVTLNSIGDAVLSTDFRGRITFMNVIAEKMTGWSLTEAAGRPLDEILFLVNSTTREHIKSPAMQAIIENHPVSLETARVLIRKDGVELAIEDTASPIHDSSGGVVGAVMVAHDVTIAREQADRFERLALYDNLTGLPNRSLLGDRLDQAVERAHRVGGAVALLFIDLDRFKPINDLQGHAIGDQLLKLVAKRLLTCVRSSDTVSRYGGDEFIIMLPDIPHTEDAAKCAQKALALINTPFEINGQSLQIGASIGIASCPQNATDPLMLIKYADVAMYRAKSAGRNTFAFFAEDMALRE